MSKNHFTTRAAMLATVAALAVGVVACSSEVDAGKLEDEISSQLKLTDVKCPDTEWKEGEKIECEASTKGASPQPATVEVTLGNEDDGSATFRRTS